MQTKNDGRWHRLSHSNKQLGPIRISTPGISVEAIAAVPDVDVSAVLSETTDPASDISAALKLGGYQEHLDTRLKGLGHRKSKRTSVLQVEVPVRKNQLVIAVKIERGILQFYFPVSSEFADIVPPERGVTTQSNKRSVYRRFSIPIHQARSPSIKSGHFAFMGASPGDVIVRFFVRSVTKQLVRASADVATRFVVRTFERMKKGKESLKYMSDAAHPLTKSQVNKLKGETLLLFIHGILSSLDGGFAPYTTKYSVPRAQLERIYGPTNIVGWDHWTLGRTPYENAEILLELLPLDTTIDIVCHSRGAAVARALTEHPDLEKVRKRRRIRFRKVISVAGAAQGSQLAQQENWKALVDVLSYLASVDSTPGVLSCHGIVALLTLIAHGALNLPGVAALCPTSEFYDAINQSPYGPQMYLYARANYRAVTPFKWLWQKFVSIAFGDIPHDLVVPYEGAALFDKDEKKYATKVRRLKNYGTFTRAQPEVYHTNFFQQFEIRYAIAHACAGYAPPVRVAKFLSKLTQPSARLVPAADNEARRRFGNIKWN